jgi:glyoxylase-like metal-dependent hydrolase (beta-lactamase superfamily II)
MGKTPAWTAVAVGILSVISFAQDARSVVGEAARVIGATGLTSITYTGVAAQGNFGQSRTISFGLASTSIANYTHTIDFDQPVSRTTGVTTPPGERGGPPPQRGTLDETVGPNAPWREQFQIWVTPWGFLRGAAAHGATVREQRSEGVRYRVVTWVPPQKAPSGQPYRVVGYINADNLVERVETWLEHPIFGDMHVETFFRDYRDFGGLIAPTRIAQRQVGMETFVVGIGRVQANPPDLPRLLGSPAGAGAPASALPPVASERIADGVFRIGGAYTSLLVEFRDHVVVLEAGENEARGLAIIAETKRLFPGKRIRYVVNTHPHFDHAAGLPPLVAEGAVVLTDDPNRYFLEQALRSPRTLVGDLLAKSRRKATVEAVVDKMVLADGQRVLELHHIQRLEHSDGMLVAFLPKERILFTADFVVPERGQPPSPALVTLVENLERLGLEFDRHVTVHPSDSDSAMTLAAMRTLAQQAK